MFARSVANSPMSLPGENAFSPAPLSTMQRNESSAERRPTVSPSSRHIGLVSALSFSGRFSTTVAIVAVALDLDQFGHGRMGGMRAVVQR